MTTTTIDNADVHINADERIDYGTNTNVKVPSINEIINDNDVSINDDWLSIAKIAHDVRDYNDMAADEYTKAFITNENMFINWLQNEIIDNVSDITLGKNDRTTIHYDSDNPLTVYIKGQYVNTDDISKPYIETAEMMVPVIINIKLLADAEYMNTLIHTLADDYGVIISYDDTDDDGIIDSMTVTYDELMHKAGFTWF